MDLRIAQKYDLSEDMVMFNRHNFELEIDMIDAEATPVIIYNISEDARAAENSERLPRVDELQMSREVGEVAGSSMEVDILSSDAVVEMDIDVLTRLTEQDADSGGDIDRTTMTTNPASNGTSILQLRPEAEAEVNASRSQLWLAVRQHLQHQRARRERRCGRSSARCRSSVLTSLARKGRAQ